MAVTETVPFTRQSPNEVQRCLWNSECEKRINFHLITYKHIDRRAACFTRLRYRSCHEFSKALALFSESRSFAFLQHQKRLNPLEPALTPIYSSHPKYTDEA